MRCASQSIPAERLRAPRALALALLCTGLPLPGQEASGQEAPDQETRIPVSVLGGKVVTRCEMASPTNSGPANLWIEIGRPGALQLHHMAAESLGVAGHAGQMVPVTIEFPGPDVVCVGHGPGDEIALARFTRRYAPQLDQIHCVGGLGAKVLSDYTTIVDLARGVVMLRPWAPRDAMPDGPETTYLPADVIDGVAWIRVELADGATRMLAIGSSCFDSIVDAKYCEEIGAPDGRIGPVRFARLDASEIVAWRPEPLPLEHPDGALGILGIDFLQSFRVEIDARNGFVGLTRVAEQPFPAVDAAFFAARATKEPAPLLAWLEANHDSRLGHEAATAFLRQQLGRAASADQLAQAVRWAIATEPEDSRATAALELADDLAKADRHDVALAACQLGIDHVRQDRYPESVHRLHTRIGELLLQRGDDHEARRHLLSAAFGLAGAVGNADLGKVNLLLGELHQRAGKLDRAMSRYLQAVISPEHGATAVAAIERLQALRGGAPFSVDLIDKLLGGKVRTIVAPTKFEPDAETRTNRCILIEHVVNPQAGRKQGERWDAYTEGGAAIFHALLTYFPRERVAMLAYHSDKPQAVGIMNELSLRAAERNGGKLVFTIDGEVAADGVCLYPEADAAYDRIRRAALERLAAPSEFTIALEARLRGDEVTGVVELRGPARAGVSVELVLAEEGVLYPGLGATVVHRMVARGALTGDLAGLAWEPTSGGMRHQFSRALADVEAANVRFLEDFEQRVGESATRMSTHIARDQLTVVAILRERSTGMVLQAAQVEVEAGGRQR